MPRTNKERNGNPARGTLGAPRPQTPRQEGSPPGPHLAILLVGKNGVRSPVTLGRRKACGFWPLESWQNFQGESFLSPEELFQLSPDALHPGWRLQPPGQKHNGDTPVDPVPAWITGNQHGFYAASRFRRAESRGRRPLVQVHEGCTGPRPVPFLFGFASVTPSAPARTRGCLGAARAGRRHGRPRRSAGWNGRPFPRRRGFPP